MSMVALVSAGGSPGATATALALALAWPDPVLVAECDTDGGDMAVGFFGGQIPAGRGLVQFLLRAKSGDGVGPGVVDQAVPLDAAGARSVLLGPPDPFSAQAITSADWEQIAGLLAGSPQDVLVDLGQVRAQGFPFPVLAAADLTVMAVRRTARQVLRARPRIAAIREALGPHAPVGLCLIGDGPYDVEAIRGFLGEFAVVVLLPEDRKAAARLSDGLAYRGDIRLSALLRAARPAVGALRTALTHRRPMQGVIGGRGVGDG